MKVAPARPSQLESFQEGDRTFLQFPTGWEREFFCSRAPSSFLTPTVQGYSESVYFGSYNEVLLFIPCHFQAAFTSRLDIGTTQQFKSYSGRGWKQSGPSDGLVRGEWGVCVLTFVKRGKLKWLTVRDRNIHRGLGTRHSRAWRIQKNGLSLQQPKTQLQWMWNGTMRWVFFICQSTGAIQVA